MQSYNLPEFQATHIRLLLYVFFCDIPYQYALSPSFCTAPLSITIISLPPFSGSPSVTSLRYDYQSRTLTCTSTGGPATTVTWRKNGIVITLNATYQQTKRLTDNSTSTYQTVLTIDPSVSQSDILGTYNCTVENARGRSSRMAVIGKLILYTCCCYLHYIDKESHPTQPSSILHSNKWLLYNI